jgi:hypothetical protein
MPPARLSLAASGRAWLLWAALGWGALGLATGCGPADMPAQDAAAEVGGREIPYQSFEAYLAANVGETEPQLGHMALSRLFDQFLDEELLTRLAEDSGMNLAADRRQAVETLLASYEAQQISPTELELYYAQHQEEFRRPERVRLRQILVEEEWLAEQARKALEGGESFDSVSERLSEDPAAAVGGEQGELAREDLSPAFAEVVFALEPGEISPIVTAEYGYHIFQVTERLPEEVVPLDEAMDSIRGRLRRQNADQQLARLLDEARRRYNVEIYERNLPFNYRGSYGAQEIPSS